MLQESQRQLIQQSEFTVVVLGKGEEFVLLRANGDDNDSDLSEAHDAGLRGMRFCGVLCLVDGQLKADLDPANVGAVYTMMFAGLAFVHLVAERLKKPKGDGAAWMANLFALPDPRTN